MSTKLFFRRRWYLNIVLLVVLLFTPGSSSVIASSPCLDTYCYFLPYISYPVPVRIIELGTGCTYEFREGAVGNVVTTTPDPVYDVSIELRLFDQDNELITTTLGTPVFTATLPGQRNPFAIDTFINCDEVASTEVEIVSWSMSSDVHYIAPTIVTTNTVQIFDGVKVGVTIQNETDQPITNVQGMVWNLGDIEGYWPEPVTDYLAPGATTTFTDTIWISSGPGPFTEPIWIAVQGITEP